MNKLPTQEREMTQAEAELSCRTLRRRCTGAVTKPACSSRLRLRRTVNALKGKVDSCDFNPTRHLIG
jgi:hypothetical protein